jgi:hypothetical protein
MLLAGLDGPCESIVVPEIQSVDVIGDLALTKTAMGDETESRVYKRTDT